MLQATSCQTFFEKIAIEKGFDTVDKYFRSLSSHMHVGDIDIPMLSIHAKDDGVCEFKHVPMEDIRKNENIIQVNVGGGSHITFLSGNLKPKMVRKEFNWVVCF